MALLRLYLDYIRDNAILPSKYFASIRVGSEERKLFKKFSERMANEIT